mmetsp:Transcript_122271/g.228390  ORF Transcript_122271/g.228390 Transcript_122271/m.228390 type:complete len:207 (-) Transcript_122271:600-1220(-)
MHHDDSAILVPLDHSAIAEGSSPRATLENFVRDYATAGAPFAVGGGLSFIFGCCTRSNLRRHWDLCGGSLRSLLRRLSGDLRHLCFVLLRGQRREFHHRGNAWLLRQWVCALLDGCQDRVCIQRLWLTTILRHQCAAIPCTLQLGLLISTGAHCNACQRLELHAPSIRGGEQQGALRATLYGRHAILARLLLAKPLHHCAVQEVRR